MKKDTTWLKDIKITHRGLHNIDKGVPENTIAAFEKSIESNLAIELDVHLLKDNAIIVFHDDVLNRCCNMPKKIKNMSLNELKDIVLFNTDHKIPTLQDTLDYIDGRVPIIIEVKTDVPAKKICTYLLDSLKNYKGKVAIKSFSPFVCLWFKKHAPEYVRGMLVADFKKDKKHRLIKQLFITSLIFLPICKPDFLSVSISMLKYKKIKKEREKGLIVLGWTFRNKLDEIKYNSFCDSHIFEEKGEI